MKIDGQSLPASDPEPPPTPMGAPGGDRDAQPSPNVPLQEGVIFQPQMDRDEYQHPTLKGLFRWDLE